MNEALDRLAQELDLDSSSNDRLRLEFAYACALRVKHLLEESSVLECLAGLGQYLDGTLYRFRLEQLAADAARLANQHQGSKSIDGCGHAAVSAAYAVANALAGRHARQPNTQPTQRFMGRADMARSRIVRPASRSFRGKPPVWRR